MSQRMFLPRTADASSTLDPHSAIPPLEKKLYLYQLLPATPHPNIIQRARSSDLS